MSVCPRCLRDSLCSSSETNTNTLGNALNENTGVKDRLSGTFLDTEVNNILLLVFGISGVGNRKLRVISQSVH